jgi:hypothetical protein
VNRTSAGKTGIAVLILALGKAHNLKCTIGDHLVGRYVGRSVLAKNSVYVEVIAFAM